MKDKYLHFFVCFVATFIIVIISKSIPAGVCYSVGLSIGKEYGDSNSPVNKWSWLDLLADGLGIIAALLLFIVISKGSYA